MEVWPIRDKMKIWRTTLMKQHARKRIIRIKHVGTRISFWTLFMCIFTGNFSLSIPQRVHARAICSDQCLRRDAARMRSQEETAVTSRNCDDDAHIFFQRVWSRHGWARRKSHAWSSQEIYIPDRPDIFDRRIESVSETEWFCPHISLTMRTFPNALFTFRSNINRKEFCIYMFSLILKILYNYFTFRRNNFVKLLI